MTRHPMPDTPDRLGDAICDNGHRHFKTSDEDGYGIIGSKCECGSVIRPAEPATPEQAPTTERTP